MTQADLSFILNELGEDRNEYYGAIAPPIVQTSNFSFQTIADMRTAFQEEFHHLVYSRGFNPTVNILRQKLAALDGAEDCLVFNSGASAISASVFSQVQSGDHIVSVHKPYGVAQRLFSQVLPRFGVATTFVDGTRIESFERAILPTTKVIYLESPNSWDYALQDLRAVAELANAEGIVTICDNSYCTPLYQRPIDLGIDMVLQSATKYIGGHSDVMAGVLTGPRTMMEKIFNRELMNMGNGISPYHAWLLIRSLRTLPIRLERITKTTNIVVERLRNHPRIEELIFPFDPSFPQYELARQQMTGACGLVTIVMKTEQLDEIVTFCESLRHILLAVSWGGHESLAIPKCAYFNPDEFDPGNREHRMVRLYIGLEEPEYILSDLEQALDIIQ